MNGQRGVTLAELLIVLAVASLALLAVGTYAVPWVAREGLRSAIYDVQTYMQLARIEAISRNRDCRFAVDTSTNRISVLDTVGTVAVGDDILLYESDIPDTVSFARPDTGSAVTLDNVSGSIFQARFGNDGIVNLGTGEVHMFGGSKYEKVEVFGAGGIRIQKWNGTSWTIGS
jgi:prepilin-type N-terminal cleavage/methylation domain-containing protein